VHEPKAELQRHGATLVLADGNGNSEDPTTEWSAARSDGRAASRACALAPRCSTCDPPFMDVCVVAAQSSQREVLRNLIELYAYDFSEIEGFDVDDTGRFPVYPLDAYWEEPGRLPFLIRAGERLAGFALLHDKSRLSGDSGVWDMAEFFVLRKYRRAGVGTRAAHGLFSTHRGPWEVRQRRSNVGATGFWRRCIASYTSGRFDEIVVDDERWRGPVQRFVSG
jgi:predicted acetyltransferase